MNMYFPIFAITALSLGQSAMGFDYSITSAGDISLTDVATDISDIETIFVGELCSVTVSGLEWESNGGNRTKNDVLTWKTAVEGVVQATGTYDLSTLESRELPNSLDVGNIQVDKKGRHKIEVTISVDQSEESTSAEYEAFQAFASIVPLLVVLVLAMGTRMVELSLFSAVFVGACMVSGNLKDGFKSTLDTHILNAVSDVGHGYVYLFTLFLSGMVAMLQKSGGMKGFTQAIAKYATSPRLGMVATFAICCCVFFDDYTNLLLTGSSVKPLTDLLFISREKITFLVDATAAPLASLTPISSWVGFEVSLIQTEITRLAEIYGEENLTIDTSAIAVFLQSIKYRYYPIFMIMLIPLLIYSQRDFGPMLIAERKARVYMRTDGGEGKVKAVGGGMDESNAPRKDTPAKAWNMAVPVTLLVFFIFYLLVQTGDDGTGTQSLIEKIEASDSYAALLWGTMGTTGVTFIFYLVQIVQGGELVLPTWSVIKQMFFKNNNSTDKADDATQDTDLNNEQSADDETESLVEPSDKPRPLMSVFDGVESFLYGMSKIFPALIVLTLAWASGSIMTSVGADRLFSRWIVNGVSAEAMPTLSFLIAVFMALATGSSWGTMTILFPLLCVPTYQVANGDPIIFYSTVAGILSGSVAGDHVSPISDTTVISSMSCGCQLLQHVVTQAPYAVLVSVFSILFGTLPIGRQVIPNFVMILIGAAAIVGFVYLLCAPIVCANGRFDPVTQLYMKVRQGETPLKKLQNDTIALCHDEKAADPTVAAEVMSTDGDLASSVGEDLSVVSGSKKQTQIPEPPMLMEAEGVMEEVAV